MWQKGCFQEASRILGESVAQQVRFHYGPARPALPVAAAIRDAHAGGLRAAAKLLQDRGELLLAMEVRKLIEETEKSEISDQDSKGSNVLQARTACRLRG
jgi:hypothetical protein